MDTIGSRIRVARELAGISQRELARLAKIAAPHPSFLESGRKRDARASTLAAIAGALGVTMDWMINGTGDPPTRDCVLAAVTAARAKLLENVAQEPSEGSAAE